MHYYRNKKILSGIAGDQNSAQKNRRPLQIDELTGDLDIAEHFACHFKNICAIKTVDGNKNCRIYTQRKDLRTLAHRSLKILHLTPNSLKT
jgi:hypothetical protein